MDVEHLWRTKENCKIGALMKYKRAKRQRAEACDNSTRLAYERDLHERGALRT
jgi:hypothetical protein